MIIGIDPGTSASPGGGLGVAWLSADEEGCFTLKRAPHESLAGYCCRVRDEIEGLLPPVADGCMVVVEQPFFHPKFPGAATGLFRVVGVVEEVACRMGAAVVGVAPTTLRSANGVKATGRGGKAQMINEMKARGHSPSNEHEADAWACVEHALRHTVAA